MASCGRRSRRQRRSAPPRSKLRRVQTFRGRQVRLPPRCAACDGFTSHAQLQAQGRQEFRGPLNIAHSTLQVAGGGSRGMERGFRDPAEVVAAALVRYPGLDEVRDGGQLGWPRLGALGLFTRNVLPHVVRGSPAGPHGPLRRSAALSLSLGTRRPRHGARSPAGPPPHIPVPYRPRQLRHAHRPLGPPEPRRNPDPHAPSSKPSARHWSPAGTGPIRHGA